jgi:DNA-binding NtrC family response regulator
LDALVAHFLGGSRLRPTPAAWAALRAWRWPGNVRELRAEVLRWTVFCTDRVGVDDLSPELRGHRVEARSAEIEAAPRSLAVVVAEAEQAAIAAAMAASGGNLSQAARLLEIDRNTLKRKLPGRA